MVLVVKINTETRKGAEAVRLLKKLKASESAIRFENSKEKKGKTKLSDEAMAQPGPKVKAEDLETWLNEPDDETLTLEEAREKTRKFLNGQKKGRK